MISCGGCQQTVVALTDACLAQTNLVTDLSKLHNHQREIHQDYPKLKFKTGKLRCGSCGGNWGNVQNNIGVKPWKGKEAACLKFDTMRFRTSSHDNPVKLSSASLQQMRGSGVHTMWLTEEIIVQASGGQLNGFLQTLVASTGVTSKNGTKQEAPIDDDGLNLNSLGFPLRPGSMTCKFFKWHGTCWAGKECEYDHPERAGPCDTGLPQGADEAEVSCNSLGFPLRPGAAQCEHFLKHGTCKFGKECWKDHPEPEAARENGRKQKHDADDGGVNLNSLGLPLRPGTTTCRFFMRHGTCKFGQDCEYDHPERSGACATELPQGAEEAEVSCNSLGFPLRPGAATCEFFLKYGTCKFGKECWKDHPEPGARGSEEPQGTDKEEVCLNSLGFPLRPDVAPCEHFLKYGTCKFGKECWKDHPEPEGAREIMTKQKHDADDGGVNLNSLGLPLRPGTTTCWFFMRNGICQFGKDCEHDHPERSEADSTGQQQREFQKAKVSLNGLGLPLRPGAAPCEHFQKHGTCKFGKDCKFDHSEPREETASSEDQSLKTEVEVLANSFGLPLRPGCTACQAYLKTGRCKFGMQCRKDHPEKEDALTETIDDQDGGECSMPKDGSRDSITDASLWNAKRKSQRPVQNGDISEYYADKGFGFIRYDCPDQGRTKLFFHVSAVSGSGGLAPHRGDKVCFQISARKVSAKSTGTTQSEEKLSAQRVVVESLNVDGRTVQEVIECMEVATSQLRCCDEDFLARRQTLAKLSDCPAFWHMVTTFIAQSARAGDEESTIDSDSLQLLSSLLSLLQLLLDTHAATAVVRALLESSLYDAGSDAATLLAHGLRTQSRVREQHKEMSTFAAKSLPSYAYRLLSVLEPAVEHAETDVKLELLPLLLQLLKTATVSTARITHPEVTLLDWRSMPLEPTTHELLPPTRCSGQRALWTRESPLPKVRKVGPYPDVGTYMDTYLRLLREDCFHALKKGVRKYLDGNLDQRDMRTYSCRLAGLYLQGARGRAGVAMVLHVKPHREVRDWKLSDALMFGNLLCLSGDGTFREPLWVIVLERSPEILQSKGLILVELCAKTHGIGEADHFSLVDAVKSLLSMGEMVAAESPTYYRAYQSVLETLQSMDVRTLPFQSELVSVMRPHSGHRKYPSMSHYLQRATWLDTKVVFDKGIGECRSNGSLSPVETLIRRLDEAVYEEQCPESSLDHFQLAAVRHVLTNRLAVIQGGPGCGKSTVGIRLVRLLLSCLEDSQDTGPRLHPMDSVFSDIEEDEPAVQAKTTRVLVIAYKNHALDDILSGLLRSGISNIARVGGRSANKELEERNLNVLRRERSSEGQSFFRQRKGLEEQLEELRPRLEAATRLFASCRFFSSQGFVRHASRCNIGSLLRGAPKDMSASAGRRKKRGGRAVLDDPEFLLDAIERALENADLSFNEFLSADAAELNPLLVGLQAHTLQVVDEALSSWMPASSEFERVNSQLGGRSEELARSFDGLSQRVRQQDASVDLEAEDEADKDLEEVEKERLAALLESGRSGKERDFLAGMISLLSTPSHGQQVEFSLAIAARMGPREEAALLDHDALWDMTPVDRVLLTQLTLARQLREAEHAFVEAFEEFVAVLGKIQQLEDTEAMCVLRRQQVVGMTSTGACLYQHYVRELQPTVVLVEEAAELLESHVLPLLQQSVEHVILIGDQNQLPPSVNAYHLKKEHGFGLSMMERLICNGLEYAKLMRQSRMHPDFSVFLRDRYPEMEDNIGVVEALTGPKCMAERLFWWNHSYPEKEGRSPSNLKEAERVVCLAMYLVLQGVPINKITILSPYVGQVMLLRRLVRQKLPDVQSAISKVFRTLTGEDEEVAQLDVQAADKFQGDENDVIILSMVRSNANHIKGFMETEEGVNRRVVMQSRQRKALYIVGNAQCFECNKGKGGEERPSRVWSSYISQMRQQQRLGNDIVLQCPRHRATLRAGTAEKIPDSLRRTVCNQQCNATMGCGVHRCSRNCHHEWEGCHDSQLCTEEVLFKCEDGHSLRRRCNQSPEEIKCQATVQFPCPAVSTHMLTRECWQLPSDVRCHSLVDFCCSQGHALQRKCYESPTVVARRCRERCRRMLPCKHECPGICGETCDPRACKVSIKFTCKAMGHPQERFCGQAESEVPCLASVFFKCKKGGHRLQRNCCQQDEDIFCSFPCDNVLACGHKCLCKCGEPCPVLPSQCSICNEQRKLAIEKEKEAAEMLQQQVVQDAIRELEELRANPEATLPPVTLDPRRDADELSEVKRRVEKLGKSLMLNLQVDKVQKVGTAASQRQRQLEAKRRMIDAVAPSEEHLYFVHEKIAESIAMTGIRLPRKPGELGRAVVFRKTNFKDGTLVLCDVLVGRTWSVHRGHRDFWQLGMTTLESLRAEGYDSVLAPPDRDHGEELAIYDAAAIRPQYIVNYRTEMMTSSLAAQPSYWKSKGAEEGRGWRAMPASADEKAALSKALAIEGSLGGRDTRAPGIHSGFRLACAWRIEHPGLWGKFSAERWNMKKNEMPLLQSSGVRVSKVKVRQALYDATRDLPAELDGDLNEVFLSHGTKPDCLLSILSSGCNERYSGGMFGHGTYFAEDVAKNDQYVTEDARYDRGNQLHEILYKDVKHPGKVYYVLFCRVLLGHPITTRDGKTSVGRGGSIWASPREPHRELTTIEGASRAVNHHSLLAETGGIISRFREFIVFHGDRVYPEYLVAYQRQ